VRSREGWLAVMMALIAGYVDAIGFTRLFDVFPANQSGNAVLLGVAVGDPSWDQGWRPGLSMVMFVLGVAIGFTLGARLAETRRAPVLLAIEGVLLVVFAAWAGEVTHDVAPIGGAREVFLLTVSSLAMGVETDVVRRVAGVSVYTTFQTGTIARLAETGAEEVEHVLGVRGVPKPPTDGHHVLAVLGAVIGGYIIGSAIGAAIVSGWGYALWVPAIVCVGLVFVTARPRRSPA
jgi:uncharacterized membrane protein YoaK (UPF0700 family)